jgi:hypothetical protein
MLFGGCDRSQPRIEGWHDKHWRRARVRAAARATTAAPRPYVAAPRTPHPTPARSRRRLVLRVRRLRANHMHNARSTVRSSRKRIYLHLPKSPPPRAQTMRATHAPRSATHTHPHDALPGARVAVVGAPAVRLLPVRRGRVRLRQPLDSKQRPRRCGHAPARRRALKQRLRRKKTGALCVQGVRASARETRKERSPGDANTSASQGMMPQKHMLARACLSEPLTPELNSSESEGVDG